eukprot:4958429-Prymnesium_polylepis.2
MGLIRRSFKILVTTVGLFILQQFASTAVTFAARRLAQLAEAIPTPDSDPLALRTHAIAAFAIATVWWFPWFSLLSFCYRAVAALFGV